jgi:hypothetical protein
MVNEHLLRGWDLALGCLSAGGVAAAESRYHPILGHAIR